MNNSEEWVSHNLRRQRQILEEKQRQRRMQNNGISSSVFERPPTTNSAQTTDSLMSRSSLSSIGLQAIGFENNKSQRGSIANVRSGMPSLTTLKGKSLINTSPSLNSSLYSLGNGNSSSPSVDENLSYHRQRSTTSSFVQQASEKAPKIITVKGFTPPELRKSKMSSESSGEFQKEGHFMADIVPQKPIVNVDRSDRFNLADSNHFINSENEDDATGNSNRNEDDKRNSSAKANGVAKTLDRNIRSEFWDDFDDKDSLHYEKKSRSYHNDIGVDASERDELDSIPTEIVNEENPIGVVDIINNLDQFVMQPIKKNTTLKCKITRDKKGMDKGMFPIYYLHLEKVDGKRIFLLAARRRKKSTTANYLISTDPTDLSRNGKSFVAKIRSNVVGTAFTIYDKGENPKKASVIGEGVRQELAAIIYETNVLGLRGPRKMIIIIPGTYVDEKNNYVRPLTIRPISEKDSILERYNTHRLDEMVVLNNKQPVWSEESQSYVLNFHGRVTQASVKNFQIVYSLSSVSDEDNSAPYTQPSIFSAEQNEYIVMQFGRVSDDNFTMDVRYPLSPVQAFGIAMTSFHKKLACD